MIWESHYWKIDLLKDAEIIERWSKKTSSTKQKVLLEKKIFIAAYSIRKLIEANKLCDHLTKNDIVSLKRFKGIHLDQVINFMNNHKFDKFYNFNDVEIVKVNLKSFADKIIHSLIFNFTMDKKPIDGFLVASDWDANPKKDEDRFIFEIELSEFINILKNIGRSGINISTLERNEKGKMLNQSLRCGMKNCFKAKQ